jgi:hypothetical protein
MNQWHNTQRARSLVKLGIVALFVSLLTLAGILSLSAQDNEWQTLEQIYASYDIALGHSMAKPSLIADAAGGLHAVWGGATFDQPVNGLPDVIMYAHWDGESWSEPNDIFIGEGEQRAVFPTGVVDNEGFLHLIWGVPRLRYSKVPIALAADANEWSAPYAPGNNEIIVSPSDMEIDSDGNLHIVVADGDTGDVYHMFSADKGETWREPVAVSLISGASAALTTNMAIDSNNTIHVVWTQIPLPEAYPPRGVFYSRSADGGLTWSPPASIVGNDYGDANIAVAPDETVHIVYNGRAGVGGKYHRWSQTGGVTWSDPFEIVPAGTGGMNTAPGLQVDAQNRLHMVAGTVQNVWYSVWEDNTWSPLYDLRSLALTPLLETEWLSSNIVSGNQIHSIIIDGTGSDNNDQRDGLWHTWSYIDAPAIEPVSFEVEAEVVNSAETAPIITDVPASPTATPVPTGFAQRPPTNPFGLMNAIVIGILASIAVIGIFIFWRTRQRVKK